MTKKTYSIFGAGASGLYTAWRLLNGQPVYAKDKAKQLGKGDCLELYDWGKYDFSKAVPGTREAGARVCTWHYKNDKRASYLELGGMRYSFWDGSAKGEGHRLVTTTIAALGLDKYSVPFNESGDPLLSLRTRNMYLSTINSNNPAPYAVDHYGADVTPDDGFAKIEAVAVTEKCGPSTRREWCEFYQKGQINIEMPDTSIFQKGDYLKDIGYWNLAYDRLGQEGFSYTADGNGYSSNVVNSNSAQSFQVNNEFTPGTEYKTLTTGFSSLFVGLFQAVVRLAGEKGVKLDYHHNTRLRSIVERKKVIHYTTASRNSSDQEFGAKTCDAAFLAMPRRAIELVAQASRYNDEDGLDVLNHEQVQLYLESVIMEPSYKVGMFFEEPWWREDTANPPKYPAKLTSYFVTKKIIKVLAAQRFPANYLKAMSVKGDPKIIDTSYNSKVEFLIAIEQRIEARLTIKQQNQLLEAAELDTIGPSVTDMPIRQVVYFGDNALNKQGKKVYGILASYDDIRYTTFWKALELGPKGIRKTPESRDCQPLEGPRQATP